MAKANVMVTTTPSLEGWEIESYLGPISSHIVAGTGFFSDFAASFSDVFGGRSQTYQRQLSAINNEVIESLKNKASLLGANFIVGLRIDHDEISGKSKQMFMVTAYGTAVRALQVKTRKSTSEKRSILVSSEEIAISLKAQAIIKKCQTLPITLTEEEQNFTIEHQISGIAQNILDSLQDDYVRYQSTSGKPGTAYERRYFLSLPSDIAIESLYAAIVKHDLLFTFIYETISQADLFDFPSLKKLFESDQLKTQKRALYLSQTDKPFYSFDDIEMFSQLIAIIKSTFVVRVKYIEEKSILSANVKEKWICTCDAKNDKEKLRCSQCERDIYGFVTGEPTPVKVIELLESKAKYLSTVFKK